MGKDKDIETKDIKQRRESRSVDRSAWRASRGHRNRCRCGWHGGRRRCRNRRGPGRHGCGSGCRRGRRWAGGKSDCRSDRSYGRGSLLDKKLVREPYYEKGVSYEQYAPAYRTGYEGRAKYAGRTFEDVERDLEKNYAQAKGDSSLRWDQARPAAHAAWHRDRSR